MARILLLLQQQGNRRLLGEWLARHHDVFGAEALPAAHDPFDLILLDGPSLERLRHEVKARKQAEEPVFLPCVLLAPRQQAALAGRYLGHTVDELLLLPIAKVELQARTDVLLRLRQQSRILQHIQTTSTALLRGADVPPPGEEGGALTHDPFLTLQDTIQRLQEGDFGTLTDPQQRALQVVSAAMEQLKLLLGHLIEQCNQPPPPPSVDEP